MSSYVQLLGSDTPDGYGGCCFYGPIDHPALRESATVPATDSKSPCGELPQTSSHIHVIDAEANPSASSCTSSLYACGDDGPDKCCSSDEVGDVPLSSSSNWFSYLAAERPRWPRAGPLHPASVLSPRPPPSFVPPSEKSAGSPLPVTSEIGMSGSEGYLFFNCPEGTQRFSSEANIKLKKVRGFFFTRWSSAATARDAPSPSGSLASAVKSAHHPSPSADAVSAFVESKFLEPPAGAASAVMGLPGMLFTIHDAGVRHATFFGPSAALDASPPTPCMGDLRLTDARDCEGGGESQHANSEHARVRTPGALGGSSSALTSARRSMAAAAERPFCSPRPSAGLRDFLTALRFHYFQYRPMVFRQLHGVMRNTTDPAAIGGGGRDVVTNSSALDGYNQVHFLETLGESPMFSGAERDSSPADASPFILATLPLSRQSLLICFRVSGGRGLGTARCTTAASASTVGDVIVRPAPLVSSSTTVTDDSLTSYPSHHTGFSAGGEDRKREVEADAATSTASFTAPTSHDMVLGYAIIVAPGSSFDVAKARSLGVRCGPKYGHLKLGRSVEADVDPDRAGTSAASRPPPQSAAVSSGRTGNQLPAAARRWVHPHQVLRPTVATRHAYISLVLDGDQPEDVREAVTQLLGHAVDVSDVLPPSGLATTCEASPGDVGACQRSTVDDHNGGALQRLLREHFPHLAYYYDEEDEEEEEEEEEMARGTAPASPPSRRPGLRQRPRWLTLRHVIHVQPMSYFAHFEGRCRRDTRLSRTVTHQEGDPWQSTMPPAPHKINLPGLYAAYNAYVFAHVTGRRESLDHHHRHPMSRDICHVVKDRGGSTPAKGVVAGGEAGALDGAPALPQRGTVRSQSAVRLSLAPSLSFTLDDMIDATEEGVCKGRDDDDDDFVRLMESPRADSPPRAQDCPSAADSSRRTTWHLFTSFVQRRFTAFPTALVHRYHLHHLAPSLFPIDGMEAVPQRAGNPGDVGEGCTARRDTAGEGSASMEALVSGGAELVRRANQSALCSKSGCAVGSVEYWPYSLKLRCVPDAALQLPSRSGGMGRKRAAGDVQGGESAGLLQRASFPHNVACGREDASASSPSPSSTPRKCVRQRSPSRGSGPSLVCKAPVVLSTSHRAPTAVNVSLPSAVVSRPPPSAPPHRLAVVGGVASLLPYPTQASALSLLSTSFLRQLGEDHASSGAPSAGQAQGGMTAITTERCVEVNNSVAAPHQSVDEWRIGAYELGGGALGFLGTGSAVPSKYRNVSGTFLELYLPEYCFPRRSCPYHLPPREEDGAPASRIAAAGAVACAQRTGDAVSRREGCNAFKRPYSFISSPVADSQATVLQHSPWEPPRASAHQLRRGVIIMDFGEGSAGQLASLCRRVRDGSACNRSACLDPSSTSSLRGTLDTFQESSSCPRKGQGDPEEGAPPFASSSQNASVASVTELYDDSDARLGEFLLDIVLVFISHAHADHHLGLMTLLTLRHEYLERIGSASSSAAKLLVVCPTEVYAFMTDVWGGTEPYMTWLHTECTFECMPPPSSLPRRERFLSKVPETAKGGTGAYEREEKRQVLGAVGGDNTYTTAEDMKAECRTVEKGLGDPGCDASITHCCQRRGPYADDLLNKTSEQPHVVPMPLLQAHLSAWNCSIKAGIEQYHGHSPPNSSLSCAGDAPVGAAVMGECRLGGDASTARAEVQPKGYTWWDAEVITVDHPANAHALLLRFPSFLSLNKEQRSHSVYNEVGEDGVTCVTGASARGHTAEGLFSHVPNTSRVFIFSGDTRPSPFLVERSRAFTASASHRLPMCAGNSDEQPALGRRTAYTSGAGGTIEGGGPTVTMKRDGGRISGRTETEPPGRPPASPPSSLSPPSPVFILLHEATFGPGFEDEAVQKKHSTLPEAIGIGAAVQAEFVVLNHFSQRYPKLPGLSEQQLGGRSIDLVCQRRTRASAPVAVPSSSSSSLPSANHMASEGSTSLADDRRGRGGAPGPGSPAEKPMSPESASATAPREDGGLHRCDRHTENEGAADLLRPQPLADTHNVATLPHANISFSFDLMCISFDDMRRGLVSRLTPALVRLLGEYDSWGISTTQRMRSGQWSPTKAATPERVRRTISDA